MAVTAKIDCTGIIRPSGLGSPVSPWRSADNFTCRFAAYLLLHTSCGHLRLSRYLTHRYLLIFSPPLFLNTPHFALWASSLPVIFGDWVDVLDGVGVILHAIS